jgi:hypothetical protein
MMNVRFLVLDQSVSAAAIHALMLATAEIGGFLLFRPAGLILNRVSIENGSSCSDFNGAHTLKQYF